jgi:hypothetical protein
MQVTSLQPSHESIQIKKVQMQVQVTKVQMQIKVAKYMNSVVQRVIMWQPGP